MRIWGLVLVPLLVAACGAATPASPETEHWTFGDYGIAVPSGWRVQEEPDADGFNEVMPPRGEGTLLLIELSDPHQPDISAAYALDQAKRGISSTGLSTERLVAREVAPSHYLVMAEGISEDRHVLAGVHVFPPGQIVVVFFHTTDPADPMNDQARVVIESVAPTGR